MTSMALQHLLQSLNQAPVAIKIVS
jgi:hypothetical protein